MLNLFDFRLNKYKRIRKIGVPLLTEVGKVLPTPLILQAARDLEMLGKDNKTLILDDEDEISFILDRAIHDIPWPMQRWIEHICEHNLQEYTFEQQSLLRAHQQPTFSLYEVLGADPGRGIHLRDVFNHHELFLMDIGLGGTAQTGHLLATRVIEVDGIHFTSGAAVPFSPGDKDRLARHFSGLFKRGTMTWEEMMRKYAPYFLTEYKKGERIIMFSEATEELNRANDGLEDEEGQAAGRRQREKVGRNDSCPCGSGKKYKKCCLLQDEENASRVASALSYAQKKHLIKHAEDFPIDRCFINPNWKDGGLARIVVSRRQEDGNVMAGVFLVDIFCLGVKNAFCNADLSVEKFKVGLLSKCYHDQEPIQIGINYVKEIIFGAIDYARGLGFEPHLDFKLASQILGREELTHHRDIRFGGPNGKPLYIAGPDDDAQRVLQKLRARLGEDGFEYIVPAEARS